MQTITWRHLPLLALSVATLGILTSCDKNDLELTTPPTPPTPEEPATPEPSSPLAGLDLPSYEMKETGMLGHIKLKKRGESYPENIDLYLDIVGTGLWQDKNLNGVKDAGEELLPTSEGDYQLTMTSNAEGFASVALYGEIGTIYWQGDDELMEDVDFVALDLSQLASLQSLTWKNGGIKGIQFHPEARPRELHLSQNMLTTIVLPQTDNLHKLSISENLLAGKQDFSSCTELQELRIAGNAVEELILPQGDKLSRMWAQNNKLQSIDLSQAPKLLDVNLSGNKLAELKLIAEEGDYPLKTLKLAGNKLTSIDTKKYQNLKELDCSDNLLESADLTLGIETFKCAKNPELTALDLSVERPARRFIRELDASDCPKLSSINFDGCLNLFKVNLRNTALSADAVVEGLPRFVFGTGIVELSNSEGMQDVQTRLTPKRWRATF